MEQRESFSYLKIGGNKLLLKGKNKVVILEFLEFIVYSMKNLSIDIYDLIDYIYKNYKIIINVYKIFALVKESSLYYNEITEKIYATYDIYYKEL